MTTSCWLSAAAATAAAVALAAGCGGGSPAACEDRPTDGLFRPLSGDLTYRPMPPDVEEEMQRRLREEGEELLHGVGMRQVVDNGQPVAIALVAVAAEEQEDTAKSERDFVKGFGDDEGERVTVGGVEAMQAENQGLTAIARHVDACTLVGVAGQEPGVTRRVAASVLR